MLAENRKKNCIRCAAPFLVPFAMEEGNDLHVENVVVGPLR